MINLLIRTQDKTSLIDVTGASIRIEHVSVGVHLTGDEHKLYVVRNNDMKNAEELGLYSGRMWSVRIIFVWPYLHHVECELPSGYLCE